MPEVVLTDRSPELKALFEGLLEQWTPENCMCLPDYWATSSSKQFDLAIDLDDVDRYLDSTGPTAAFASRCINYLADPKKHPCEVSAKHTTRQDTGDPIYHVQILQTKGEQP